MIGMMMICFNASRSPTALSGPSGIKKLALLSIRREGFWKYDAPANKINIEIQCPDVSSDGTLETWDSSYSLDKGQISASKGRRQLLRQQN